MSTIKNEPIKSIKAININKKIQSCIGNSTTRSNDSMLIKTTFNNINNKSSIVNIQNYSLNLYRPNQRVHSANHNLNKSAKSAFIIEKKKFNQLYNIFNYDDFFNNNKENKQNQVNFFYNDSFYNNNYKLTKVNNYYFKLKNIYNPYRNNFRIVKNKKNIIKEFVTQTKNNFNNNYKIKYYSPDLEERDFMLKCFNTIREKSKKIDNINLVKNIVIKEIYKNNNNLKKANIKNIKYNLNKYSIIPSTIKIKPFISKSSKLQIKTMKMIDDLSKNNSNIIYNNNARSINSTLFRNTLNKKLENDFFKTLPKNNRNNNIFLNYSKTSIES